MAYAISLDPLRLYCTLPVSPYFKREFRRVGAPAPQVRVRYTDGGNPPRDVRIERRGRQFTLVLEQSAHPLFTRAMRHMVCAYAYWLSLCPADVSHISVNASDGDQAAHARFAASVRFPRHVALPDPHFFQNHGFHAERQQAAKALPWEQRSNDIVWRGGMNGSGWVSFEPGDANHATVMQRVRMAMLLKNVVRADVRFVDLPKVHFEYRDFARRQGFLGAPLAARSWLGRKFAIDIDGYVNTWSNLLVRMLYGCCVLKVESQFGYRQWYYDDLKPFEHYVPVSADMGDFAEKIAWVRSHDAEAKAIAQRGRALAMAMTFEREAQRAADIIEADWQQESRL